MSNRDEVEFLEFKRLKEEKKQYLDRYGYTEKQKLNKIIDLLYSILNVIREVKDDE